MGRKIGMVALFILGGVATAMGTLLGVVDTTETVANKFLDEAGKEDEES